MANGNPKEETIVDYFVRKVEEYGGGARPLAYRGRKGCADFLAVFKFNRMFLCEMKRPRGGKIHHCQHEDATWLLTYGIRKEYLYTKLDVDNFIVRVLK